MTVAVLPANPLVEIDVLGQRVYELEQTRSGPSGGYPATSSPPPGASSGNAPAYTNDGTVNPPTGQSQTTGTYFDKGFIDVAWTASSTSGVTEYEVEITKVGTGVVAAPHAAGASLRYYYDTPNQEYSIRIRAINANSGKSSNYTAAQSITTGPDASLPSQVTGLQANAGVRTITATWNENPEEDMKNGKGSYRAEISASAAFTVVLQSVTVSALITSFSNLVTNVQHWVRVRAIDSSGNFGPWSASATATPGNLSATEIDGNVAAAYSHIANHGFESVLTSDPSKAAQWTYDFEATGLPATFALSTVAVEVKTGSRALKISVLSANDGTQVASDAIAVNPGSTWYIAGWHRAGAAYTDGTYLRAYFGDTPTFARGDAGVSYIDIVNDVASSTSYAIHEGQLTIPAGKKWMRVATLWWMPGGGGLNYPALSFWDEIIALRAIMADYIKAGQINSDHITTAGLDANTIKFGTMSGDRITANTLSAQAIKTSTLDAGVITVGSSGMLRMGRTSSPFHYLLQDANGLRFYKNGSAAFSGGTLTAELNVSTGSASFAGALNAASGTFAGSLSAATGTFSGALSAASGTFTGTVSAGTISGGSIDGATITGGIFRTGTSGRRVEIDPSVLAGIRFWDENGTFGGRLYGGSAAVILENDFCQIILYNDGRLKLSSNAGVDIGSACLKDFPMFIRGYNDWNHTLNYGFINGPILHGGSGSGLRAGDVMEWADANSASAKTVNSNNSAFRNHDAYTHVNANADPRLKSELALVEDGCLEAVLAAGAYRYRMKPEFEPHEVNPNKVRVGMLADECPSEIRHAMYLVHPITKEPYPVWGLDTAAQIAYLWGAIRELAGHVQKGGQGKVNLPFPAAGRKTVKAINGGPTLEDAIRPEEVAYLKANGARTVEKWEKERTQKETASEKEQAETRAKQPPFDQ